MGGFLEVFEVPVVFLLFVGSPRLGVEVEVGRVVVVIGQCRPTQG